MAWWDDLGSALGGFGSSAWGGVQSDPLSALSLGVGAAGTGMGIADIVKANQVASQRNFLAQQLARRTPDMPAAPTAGAPGSYFPTLSDAVRAAMVRPSAANLASAGLDPSGGAFTQGITDSLTKQYTDIYNQSEAQRLADFQAKLAAYQSQYGNQLGIHQSKYQGLPDVPQSQNSVAGLPQALQSLMVMRALGRGGGQTGAADTSFTSSDTYLPTYNIPGTGSSGLGQELSLSNFGGGGGGFYPSSAFEGQYQ